MGDATPVAATAGTPVRAKRPRRTGPPQSFTRTLYDAKGNTLQFIATIKADGNVNSYVYHRKVDANGKLQESKRGATIAYPNVDACKEAFTKAVAGAVADGWIERKGGGKGNFVAKPDAFDLNSLPKAVKK